MNEAKFNVELKMPCQSLHRSWPLRRGSPNLSSKFHFCS